MHLINCDNHQYKLKGTLRLLSSSSSSEGNYNNYLSEPYTHAYQDSHMTIIYYQKTGTTHGCDGSTIIHAKLLAASRKKTIIQFCFISWRKIEKNDEREGGVLG